MPRRLRRWSGRALVLVLSTVSPAMAAGPASRLVMAVKQQDTQAVRALLAEGVDVNAANADGATALLWAAHWDDVGTVEQLLRAGADVNAANDHGVTPLALACDNANPAMVETLLRAGAAAARAQGNGVTPLMTAAHRGQVRIVKMLLAAGGAVNAAIPATGQTALMWATAERHVDVMRELLAAGANVQARSTMGFTPLLFASRNGDIDAAQILMAAGAGVNDVGGDGTHALPLAIVSGHDRFAVFLLEHGADPNARMYGVGALHAAAGDVGMWLRDWFFERGTDGQSSGLAVSRRVSVVKALLAHGADPNARITTKMTVGIHNRKLKLGAFDPFTVGTGDISSATPLWVAAFAIPGGQLFGQGNPNKTDQSEIIRVLLAAGADPHLSTLDKTTPLMVAAGLGHGTYLPGLKRGGRTPDAEEAVTQLLDAGANVNARNEANFTALHGAAFKGLNEVVQLLVERGADINAQAIRGRTPFRLAEGSKQTFQFQAWPETAALLATLGADTSLGMPGALEERELERKLAPPPKASETGKP